MRVSRGYQALGRRLFVLMVLVVGFRQWRCEISIAVLMLLLVLMSAGIAITPGEHRIADRVIMGCLFGLTALWVRTNRAAFAEWEKDSMQEHPPCRRGDQRNT